jgi:methyl-accepting chemotaxis protein
MKVRTKLLLGFGGMAAIVLAEALSALWSYKTIDEAEERSYTNGSESLELTTNMAIALGDLRITLRDIGLAASPAEMADAKSAYEAARKRVNDGITEYGNTLDNDEDAANWQKLKTQWATFSLLDDQVAATGEEGKKADFDSGLHSSDLAAARTAFLDQFAVIVKSNIDIVKQYHDANRSFVIGVAIETGLLTILALVVAIVVALLLSRNVARPINTVVGLSKAIAEGDLTGHIPPALLKRSDELGALGKSLETMRGGLTEIISGILASTSELNSGAESLASNAHQTAASVHQISTTIQSAGKQFMAQNSGVESANQAVSTMTSRLDELEARISDQAADVAESSASVNEMVANIQSVTRTVQNQESGVGQLVAASETGRKAMQKAIVISREITSKSKSLRDANLAISDIAAQTNLLSMNAAIEAAHAGEAGSGFAVVAEEIRKLAELATARSKDIKDEMSRLSADIEAVAGVTQETNRAFEEIITHIREVGELSQQIRHAMEEQSQGSQQVLEALIHINEVTQAIRTDSKEVAAGADQAQEQMQKLNEISREIANAMDQVAQGAQEISLATNGVSDTSRQTMDQVSALTGRVQWFKTERS